MSKNFWQEFDRPIMALAPLSGVTDCAFREIIADCSFPDLMYTEFTSCDALCNEVAYDRIICDLKFTNKQRKVIAQVFGSKPENFFKTAKLCQKLGFDGIDINMGCPDKNVEKQGAGSFLMKKPKLAQELVLATKEGAGDLPVSVKTRIGYELDELDTWIPNLLEVKPASITIHARTRKQLSLVPADWSKVKKAVEIACGSGIPILGNGDVMTIKQAEELCQETGADGVMFGRAIFGNPWLFRKDISRRDVSFEVRIETMLKHAQYFQEYLPMKNFIIMRKHFASYVSGFPSASLLRENLMKTLCLEDVKQVVEQYKKYLKDKLVA